MTAENDLNVILEFLSLHPRYIPGHNNTSLTEDKKLNLSQKFLNNVNRLNFPTKGTKASDNALAPVLKKMFETENIE